MCMHVYWIVNTKYMVLLHCSIQIRIVQTGTTHLCSLSTANLQYSLLTSHLAINFRFHNICKQSTGGLSVMGEGGWLAGWFGVLQMKSGLCLDSTDLENPFIRILCAGICVCMYMCTVIFQLTNDFYLEKYVFDIFVVFSFKNDSAFSTETFSISFRFFVSVVCLHYFFPIRLLSLSMSISFYRTFDGI